MTRKNMNKLGNVNLVCDTRYFGLITFAAQVYNVDGGKPEFKGLLISN